MSGVMKCFQLFWLQNFIILRDFKPCIILISLMLASLNFPSENWSQVSSSSGILLISCVFFFFLRRLMLIFSFMYMWL